MYLKLHNYTTTQLHNYTTTLPQHLKSSAKFFILSYFVNKRIILSLQSVYYPSVKVRFSRAEYPEFVPISLIQIQ